MMRDRHWRSARSRACAYSAVWIGGEGAEQVCGPGRDAEQEEQESYLGVWEGGEGVDEGRPLGSAGFKVGDGVSWVADWGAQNLEPLLVWWEGPSPGGVNWLEDVEVGRLFACLVPRSSFAQVEGDACMLEEVGLE